MLAHLNNENFVSLDWATAKIDRLNDTPVLLKLTTKQPSKSILLFAMHDSHISSNWVDYSKVQIVDNRPTGFIDIRSLDNILLNSFPVNPQLVSGSQKSNIKLDDLPMVTITAYSKETLSYWWSLFWLFNMDRYWYNQYTFDQSLTDEMNQSETYLNIDELYNPLFKFPELSNYEVLYPKFSELVKSEIKKYVLQNENILSSIRRLTGLNNDQIKAHLTWGKVPTIIVEDIKTTYYGDKPIGQFRPKDPDKIYINKSDVQAFEDSKGFTKEAMWFLLAVTVMHEYIHYGDYKFDNIQAQTEIGLEFERELFGRYILDVDDAKSYLEFYKKKK